MMTRALAVACCMALTTAAAHADACAQKLEAFNRMLMVSKFTPEGAARVYAARDKAMALQKAGRTRDCVRVLTRAMGG